MSTTVWTLLGIAAAFPLLRAPLQTAPENDPVARGGQSFRYYCASCHGLEGRGDGPAAKSLRTPPTDLTRIQKYGEPFPSLRVYNAIDGTRDVTAHGNREMPVWGRRFRQTMGKAAEEELQNLVRFIESIQAEAAP